MKPTIPFLLLASAASGFARDPAAGGFRAEEPRVETYEETFARMPVRSASSRRRPSRHPS